MGKLSSIVDSHFVSYSVFGKFFRIPQVICDDFVLFFSLYLPFMLSLFGFQGAFFEVKESLNSFQASARGFVHPKN